MPNTKVKLKKEEQAIADKLPVACGIQKTLLDKEEWTTVSYESPNLVKNIHGDMIPQYSFSCTHRDPKIALENLLLTLKANDIGYDEVARAFTK